MVQNYEESEYMIFDIGDDRYITTIYANSVSHNSPIDSALKFDSFELADGMAKVLMKRGDISKFRIVKRTAKVEVVEQ